MAKEDVNSTLDSIVEMLLQEERYLEAARFLGRLSEEEVIKGYKTTIDSLIDKYLKSEKEEELKKGIRLHSAAVEENYDVREIADYVNDAIKKKGYQRAVCLINSTKELNIKDYVDEQVEKGKYNIAAKLIQAGELDVNEVIEDEKVAVKVKRYLKE